MTDLVRKNNGNGVSVLYKVNEDGSSKIYPSNTYWKNVYNQEWYFDVLKNLLKQGSQTHNEVLVEVDKYFSSNPNSKYLRVIYVGVDEVFEGENVVITMIVTKDNHGDYDFEFESTHEGFVLHKVDIDEFDKKIFENENYLDEFGKTLHNMTFDKFKSALDLPEDVYEEKYRLTPDTSLDVLDYYYIYDGERPLFGAGASLVFDVIDSEDGITIGYNNKGIVLAPNNTVLIVSEVEQS